MNINSFFGIKPNNYNALSSAYTPTPSPAAQPAYTNNTASGVGSSANNPYVLNPGDSFVNFSASNRPAYISYNNHIYAVNSTSNNSLLYKATQSLPSGSNKLYITFNGQCKTDVIGHTMQQVQVGTQQVQTGTQRVQVGTQHVQVGTQQVQTGTQQVQIGTEHVQVGTQQVQTGTQQVQIGTEHVQVGTQQVQTGTQQVQIGTEHVQVGTQQVQTGTQQVQVGTEQVQIGTQRVQTGTQVVGTSVATEQVNLKISRELDGKNDTGAIGDMLTRGTTQLSDASQFFNGANFSKYQVSGLTGENNQATSASTDVLNVRQGEDNMYVAGDPHVGGEGNQYAPVNLAPQQDGYLTMFEDGTDTGRKVTLNSHIDTINSQGNKAFTEYGFSVQDDAGQKTTATLSGGQLNITDPNGQVKNLKPGDQYVIGNAADPTAKFYYADMPGGENGTTEKRLVFESYEKPTQAVVDQLVQAGMSATDAAALRATTQSTYGFRVPDGQGSYRLSSGVTGSSPLNVTSNGVKTYYDAHFTEAPEHNVSFQKYTQTPITAPIYTDTPIYQDQPKYQDQPVYTNQPIFQDNPKYQDQPVYTNQPIFQDQPKYQDQPVYTNQPIFQDNPIYQNQPIYTNQPIFQDNPIYQDQPVYKDCPIYNNQCVPIYGTVHGIKKQLASPLVLDLDGKGIKTTAPNKSVDIDGDGTTDQVSWFGPTNGVLTFDANKNGKVDLNGKELLGDNSDVNGDGVADGYTNGFEALKALAAQTLGQASVADGVLDANELKALQQKAGLQILVNNQAHSLSDYGIKNINLGYSESSATDQYGNQFGQQGSFQRTLANGQTVTRNATDVWLQKNVGAPAPVASSAPVLANQPRARRK
jgi:hypothetical protein